MNVLILGLAALLTLLFAAGWVLLLSMPVIALSAAAVDGVARGVTRVGRLLPAASRGARRGILCIEGLLSEPALQRRLRRDIGRVLELAPTGTRPRACACVEESDGAVRGVLRIFNNRGHYLLRVSGESVAEVAHSFSTTLGGFENTFPATEGTRRQTCPECNPRSCPLRLLRREGSVAAA